MRIAPAGSICATINFAVNIAKTGIGWRSYLLQVHSLQEIAMRSLLESLRKHAYFYCAALATASAAACLLSADAALASQGPGGGLGTASSFTQMAMAILVWGASALVVGTGLIGIARRIGSD
jgi:hypothetical protein